MSEKMKPSRRGLFGLFAGAAVIPYVKYLPPATPIAAAPTTAVGAGNTLLTVNQITADAVKIWKSVYMQDEDWTSPFPRVDARIRVRLPKDFVASA